METTLKSLIIASVMVLSLSGVSYAAQGGEGDNAQCNGQGNPNSPCGIIGGNGGQGGQGGTSAASSKSTSKSSTASSSTASYDGYVDQHVDIRNPRQAPPAYAPNLAVAPETCMGSVSGGVSTPFGGIALGSSYKSESCEIRMFARTLAGLGQPAAALVLLGQNDERVRKALATVGIIIPGGAEEPLEAPKTGPQTSTPPVQPQS